MERTSVPPRPERLGDRIASHLPDWLDIPWLGGKTTAPWVLLSTVAVLLAAFIGARYVTNHPDRLDYATRSYTIGQHSATLTFDVQKSPTAVATCSIVALDLNSNVLGRTSGIVIGPAPDGHRTTTHSATVTTSVTATAVEIEDCRLTRPG